MLQSAHEYDAGRAQSNVREYEHCIGNGHDTKSLSHILQ